MSTPDRKTVVVALTVTICVALVGLAGVAYYSRHSLSEEAEAKQAEIARLREQLKQAEQVVPETPQEKSQRRWQLGLGPDVVGTMQKVQSLGDASGVTIDGLKAMRSSETGRQSFALSGHGEPIKVCQLMAAIEQDDRLMVLETGRILSAGGGQLAFELGLATYYREGAR